MLKVMKNPYKFAYPLISKKITVDKTKRREGREGREEREGRRGEREKRGQYELLFFDLIFQPNRGGGIDGRCGGPLRCGRAGALSQ